MPKQAPEISSGPSPMGAYSPAIEANGFVFISGQVALDPMTNSPTGGDVGAQARRVMDNIGLILFDVGLTYGDLVKTMIFLADIADFDVVNRAYGGYFGDAPPARSTVQVGGLPGGFLIEIESIATR